MPAQPAHPPAETLELFAEGALPPAEVADARVHIESCGRCSAEVEAFRALFMMLEGLPRLAPSADFADAVMARVQVAPQENAVYAWLRRLIPSTRRGWTLLGLAIVAPVLPLLTVLAWMFTQPLVSPATLWQWGMLRTQSAAQAGTAWLVDRTVAAGLPGWVEALYTTLQTVPSAALSGAVAFLAVAIPLSGWALVRLTRTPVGSVTHAN